MRKKPDVSDNSAIRQKARKFFIAVFISMNNTSHRIITGKLRTVNGKFYSTSTAALFAVTMKVSDQTTLPNPQLKSQSVYVEIA